MRKVLLLLICICTSIFSFGQITTTGSGNWSSASTWSTNAVPTSTDNVVISAGHTIAVDVASAACNSISFGATTSKLNMSTATSVLSVYGDFSLDSSAKHNAFSGWTAGAKVKFTGGATQTLNGWNTASSTSGFTTSFNEMVVDKTVGSVLKTPGADRKFSIGNSLEIISGTFELTMADDIECYDITGTPTTPTITVRANGTFDMNSVLNQSATQYIRKGGVANTTGDDPKIGVLTVYGYAKFAPSSSNRINFSAINIENAGTVELPANRNTSSSGYFNPGAITIKSGGKFLSSTTTAFWYNNATTKTSVTIKSGGEYESANSTTTIPASKVTLTQESGSAVRFSSSATTTLPADITSYKTLIFSGSGVKTLGVNTTIEEYLQLSGSFTTMSLGTFTLTYGSNAFLRYGTASTSAAMTVSAVEWPATGGPNNVQMYNSGLTLSLPRTITGTLSLTSGTLTHSGNLTMATGSTISRARGALATAPTFGATTNLNYNSSTTKVTTDVEVPSSGLNNLTMNTAMGITIGAPITVNGTLTLTNGIADLGANNLTTAAVAGGNANSFINTNGAGVLTVKNVGSASTIIPVGYTTYSPIILSNSGTTDDFSVNVSSGTICNAAALSSVNRVWNITEAVSGGSNASIGLQWSPYLEGASFIRNNSAAVHCSSGAIDIKGTIGTAAVSDTFLIQTISGISSFSPFGVTSDATTLPARGLTLSWKKLTNSNILFWKTMGEFNTVSYEVERSTSSNNFKAIGKVAAKPGNNTVENTYQFEDVQPLSGVNYYRLRVLDNNSAVQYSPVVAIRSESNQTSFQVYPNPISGKTINVAIEAKEAGIYQIGIFSLQGQLLQQEQRAITVNGSLQQIQLRAHIVPGMYLLKMTDTKGGIMKQMIAVQ